MLKKIVSSLAVIAIMIPNTGVALVQDDERKIDAIVERMSVEQMQKLDNRIDAVYQSDVELSQRNSDILQYLSDSIDTQLLSGVALSSSEKQQVTAEVMKIQENLSKGLQGQFDALIGEYTKLSNVEEKGDLSLNVDISHEEIGNVSAGLKLEDYTAIGSGFDSKIETDFSAFFTLDESGDQDGTFNISAFLDYISKDGNLYVLLDDLDIDTDRAEEMEEVIDMFKKVAEQNGYISFDNETNAQALEVLSSFAPNLILGDIQAVFEKPLLRAYKKVDNKYILVPTKYACDQGKIIGKKFDPFYGSDNCSDGQYQDVLEDFISDEAYLYMTLGNTTTLGMELQDDDETVSGNIVFQDNHILSSYFEMRNRYNELHFEYKIKSHISLNVEGSDDDFMMNLQLDLDNRNYISSGDMSMNFSGEYDAMNMTMLFKNGNISGDIKYSEGGKQLFEMSMSGKYGPRIFELNTDFELFKNPFESTLDIQYVDEEIEGEECYENYYGDEKFVCYVQKEPSGKTITGEFNISSDTKYSRNNMDILFKALLDNQPLIKVQLENKATRTFKETQVEKPENTIPYEEVFPVKEYFDASYEDEVFEVEEAEDAKEAFEE